MRQSRLSGHATASLSSSISLELDRTALDREPDFRSDLVVSVCANNPAGIASSKATAIARFIVPPSTFESRLGFGRIFPAETLAGPELLTT